jgi:hypothetical protein
MSDVEGVLFKESGSKTIDLSKGDHELSYRAVGTPNSHITLTVIKGGSLDRDVDRDLSAAGRAAGLRLVTVGMLLFALLGLAATKADAQEVVARPTEAQNKATEAQNKESVKAVQRNLITLPAAGLPRISGLSFDFEATSQEKTGAVSIVVGSTKAFSGGVTFTGPLDANTKTAEPISQTGLASGASVEFGLHWFIWKSDTNDAEARAICRRNTRMERCDDDEILDPDERQLFLRALGAFSDPVVVDVTASTGRNTFKFLDSSTFAGDKEQHSDKSFGASIGRFTPRTGLVSIGYRFAQEWQAGGAPRNICSPVAGTSMTECRTVPVGPPTMENKHEIGVEERIFFLRGRAAAAPFVAYDVKSKDASISVPVYFFATKDSNLAGGVKATWSSRNQGSRVAVFVGPAFGIFK